MSETANKANEVLAAILEKAMATAEKTGTFLQEQAPDVVQQLLTWKLAEYAICTVVFAACCVGGVYLLCKVANSISKKGGHEDTWEFVGALVGIFTTIPAGIATVHHGLVALQIWLAPKVYLIEYAASLVK